MKVFSRFFFFLGDRAYLFPLSPTCTTSPTALSRHPGKDYTVLARRESPSEDEAFQSSSFTPWQGSAPPPGALFACSRSIPVVPAAGRQSDVGGRGGMLAKANHESAAAASHA